MLLEKGADPNVTDISNRTPFGLFDEDYYLSDRAKKREPLATLFRMYTNPAPQDTFTMIMFILNEMKVYHWLECSLLIDFYQLFGKGGQMIKKIKK